MKRLRPQLTRQQVESFATQMYLNAVEEASRAVRAPTAMTARSRVLVPRPQTEIRTEAGLILPKGKP